MHEKLIEQLKTKGCRFASLTYKAKGSGEIAIHTLLLGVSLENAYKADIAKLESVVHTLQGVELEACTEMLASLKESIEKGIGNNSAYTQKGKWETVCNGIRKSENSIQIYGFSIRKKVLVKGEFKKVNSSEKTIAKNQLRKRFRLKSSRFRPFAYDSQAMFELRANKIVNIA